MSDTAEIDKIIRTANKKFGTDDMPIMIRGKDLKSKTKPRVTSGSLSLDINLGGGWILNEWNEIVGHPSMGKTVIALKTIAANQKLNPDYECLWIASEPFFADWAEKNGVDLDRTTVLETTSMETAYTVMLDAIEARAIDAVIIDSYPALLADQEDKAGMDDLQPGVAAKLNNKMYRKAGSKSRRSMTKPDRDILLISINQWRSKIGVMFGDPRVTPGGQGKDYASVIRVEVSRDGWIERDGHKVGQVIKTKCIKNKSAPQQRVSVTDFYFDDGGGPGIQAGDYDTLSEIFNIGLSYGVIDKDGNSYLYDGTPLYDGPHPSKPKALEALREDLDLQDEISEAVRRLALPMQYTEHA